MLSQNISKTGNRKVQVLRVKIRTKCSSLNNDLYQKGINDLPLCLCGHVENADHFLLKYHNILPAQKGPAPPPLGNFADISYLEENFKPHLLRDVCTLCSGALVSDSLLHMLL